MHKFTKKMISQTKKGRVWVGDETFIDPRKTALPILFIANHLSSIQRWSNLLNGRDVASHSVRVAKLVMERSNDPVVCMFALLHDAGEALVGDIPSPFKRGMKEFIKAENEVLKPIFKAYAGRQPTAVELDLVKRMDKEDFIAELEKKAQRFFYPRSEFIVYYDRIRKHIVEGSTL